MNEHAVRSNMPSNPNADSSPGSSCGGSIDPCGGVDRRNFVKSLGLGSILVAGIQPPRPAAVPISEPDETERNMMQSLGEGGWPVLKRYPQSHTGRIALPVGGIGTGTVSLGGRGDWRDWEIMNRSGKGFTPSRGEAFPFFALFTQAADGTKTARVLEGPIEEFQYEGSHGCAVPNDNLPRFARGVFGAAYPFGQVLLSDEAIPVEAQIQAFNPLVPADPEASGLPVAVMRYTLRNKTNQPLQASVCASLPNFIGVDGWETTKDWKGDLVATGAKQNRNQFRQGKNIQGIFMDSAGVDPQHAAWGTIALTVPANESVTYRTDWTPDRWGNSMLDFWDDFSADGQVDEREPGGGDMPMASLAVSVEIPANGAREIAFQLTWHFPNRQTWTPRGGEHAAQDRIGNYYTTRYADAWDAAERTAEAIPALEQKTLQFVRTFLESPLPDVVKEAALFNLSTLRSQTCFRTPDGRFFGWEGLCNRQGCCFGSCTHVWNYEQATAFLFGELALKMREVEFGQATDENGLMSFRVSLPIERARDFGKAAADGQMGCIMKMYRDWQLSGGTETLKQLWPKVKKALEFCWIPGGWDADRDGVMEGCQHNTMDVEYYGPNPQMGTWYLGALRAGEEMARAMGDNEFAQTCQDLFERGRTWMDAHLFNGEYYEHQIRPSKDRSEIADRLLVGMGSKDITKPEYQLGAGCLVDQLVGQFMAHVCGLGYLLDPEHVKTTLRSILKYNRRESLQDHFNCMRSFALGNEAALLMASYPKERPETPFPYFTEAMTGFEYTAAIGMLYEGQTDEGLMCIQDIRNRYDGLKRNPFNEAECGHHYARAMASWAAVLALTGFHYSGVEQSMTFAPHEGVFFWSNGHAWGRCVLHSRGHHYEVTLEVHHGELTLRRFALQNFGETTWTTPLRLQAGESRRFEVKER